MQGPLPAVSHTVLLSLGVNVMLGHWPVYRLPGLMLIYHAIL